MNGRKWAARGAAAAVVVSSVTGAGLAAAPPASADLLGLGGLTCTLGGVVNGLTGILTAGWDDGATTPPTSVGSVTEAIGANQLWATGDTGQGVGVALIDTGVAPVEGLTGPGKVINGPDLSFESQIQPYQYLDTYGHGTHMAGIIAGNDGPGGSFQGVAPGAHLVAVKTASYDGAVDVSQVIAGIDWVVQHRNDPGMNIRVINLSFGTASTQSYRIDPLAFAVENAWKHGIVVVVSGGNNGTSTGSLNDPAVDPYVLAVGAADTHAQPTASGATVAPFSSRSCSRHVDVVAPGVSIASLRDPGSYIDDNHPSAVVDGRFFRGSGTSQAAAVTSGAAALLLASRPQLTPDQVKALLESTARPLGLLDQGAEGAGLINVAAANSAAVPYRSAQSFSPATGTGSIEQARGGSHVSIDGIPLSGEQDIMGSRWNGATWAPVSAAAAAWNGGTWNGQVWTGTSWTGTSWTGATWAGTSWTGTSWTGTSWTGTSWTGTSWTGTSWTGTSWTGKNWNGTSWTGTSWTGTSWTGTSWTGTSWIGTSS